MTRSYRRRVTCPIIWKTYQYSATTGLATGAFNDDGIHTAAQREKNLAELRKKQAEQATTYGWVDQKAGVVRLPIDRAIELTAQQ